MQMCLMLLCCSRSTSRSSSSSSRGSSGSSSTIPQTNAAQQSNNSSTTHTTKRTSFCKKESCLVWIQNFVMLLCCVGDVLHLSTLQGERACSKSHAWEKKTKSKKTWAMPRNKKHQYKKVKQNKQLTRIQTKQKQHRQQRMPPHKSARGKKGAARGGGRAGRPPAPKKKKKKHFHEGHPWKSENRGRREARPNGVK